MDLSERERVAAERRLQMPWMLVLAALTLLFFLSFFNRFAGLRSGNGEFYTGMAWLQGHLPYRDYFSATPPLNTFKSVLLLKVFGRYLIVSRAAGVAERVMIVLVLFRWLAELFPVRFAYLASLVTIVVSAGDRSDPVASYNHDALLWAILSGFCASRALAAVDGRRVLRWAIASGFFAGFCLLTKQTVGLGAVVVVPVAVVFLREDGRVRWVVGFGAGCFVPLAAFGLWLWRMGLLGVFGTMVFHQGPAAKAGHATDFPLRALRVGWGNWSWVLLAMIAIVLSWPAIRRSIRRSIWGTASVEVTGQAKAWRVGLISAGVLLVAEALAHTRLPALEDFGKSSIYFVVLLLPLVIYATMLAPAHGDETAMNGARSVRRQQFGFFAVVSLTSGIMLSLSWPAFEAITLPGLGLLLAAALEGTTRHGRRFVYLVMAAMAFIQVREKLAMPFSFGSLDEAPIREASARSVLPELKGMRLPPEERDFIDQTTAIIRENSRLGQTIFTYPEMGLFYALADRTYPTFSGSHNVDVVNDSLARDESDRLIENPPAVLIFFAPTASEVQQEDDTWRFGRPSGQHILVAAIERMLLEYRLAGSYRISSDSRWINVYVRR